MIASGAYGFRAFLWPATALALIVGACASTEVKGTDDGGTHSDAAASNGAAGGTCGFVMANCRPGDTSIGMNICPQGRTCYLQTAGCTQLWCIDNASDAGAEYDDAGN